MTIDQIGKLGHKLLAEKYRDYKAIRGFVDRIKDARGFDQLTMAGGPTQIECLRPPKSNLQKQAPNGDLSTVVSE